ncbi:hypothetical protein AF72_08555 [Xylella taiwanensis]|uniref:Uncharacterized protein n=1 Tax=Xylella taiwanensis TaxID=1444770 RepID=Z9JI00_9GAMM|nr:hypothetical protein AB672_08450 [Xylella taiwanensis]EWS77819.1 hypothetical protein AF72_08555 [Xylella taiwanensis]
MYRPPTQHILRQQHDITMQGHTVQTQQLETNISLGMTDSSRASPSPLAPPQMYADLTHTIKVP